MLAKIYGRRNFSFFLQNSGYLPFTSDIPKIEVSGEYPRKVYCSRTESVKSPVYQPSIGG